MPFIPHFLPRIRTGQGKEKGDLLGSENLFPKLGSLLSIEKNCIAEIHREEGAIPD